MNNEWKQRKYTFVVCKGESASLKANQMKCLKFELLDGGTGHCTKSVFCGETNDEHCFLNPWNHGIGLMGINSVYGLIHDAGVCNFCVYCGMKTRFVMLLWILCCNDDVVLARPTKFYFTVTVSIHTGEEVDVNFAELMPFYSLSDYNIGNEFLTTKRKFENLLDNKQFEMFLKENKYEQIFNPTCVTPCQYFDEDEFINKNRTGEEFLNVFSLNIRSLPKHGGELLHFLKSLKTKFEVIVLTEIRAKNISVVENLIPDYNFNYVLPTKNKCGGVGIYTSDLLTNVTVLDGVKVINSCNCTKCEIESPFIEFHYKGSAYKVGGVYRHPNGKVPHFITDLETVLNKIDNGKTTVLAGDMNIDIIKFSNEDVVSYMTTLMSYRFLPYVTLPSRITNFSMTCIDHIFFRLSHKDKAVNMISGLFYCDISDHLPCFISIKHNRQCNAGERPLTRLFGEKNSAVFVQKMEAQN